MKSYTEIDAHHIAIYHEPGSNRIVINAYDDLGRKISETWYDSSHAILRAFDVDSMDEDNLNCIQEALEDWKDYIDILQQPQ